MIITKLEGQVKALKKTMQNGADVAFKPLHYPATSGAVRSEAVRSGRHGREAKGSGAGGSRDGFIYSFFRIK